MSFSQWSRYGPIPTVVPDITDADDPVDMGQSGWLRYKGTPQFVGVGHSVPSSGGGLPRGQLRGRLGGLLAGTDKAGAGSVGIYAGLTFLQSQEDMTAGGACYAAVLAAPYATDPYFALYKFPAGIDCLDSGQIIGLGPASPPSATWAKGSPLYFFVQWDASPLAVQLFGGPVINVTHGTSADLSDQVPVVNCYHIVDTTAPFTTTVAEGFFTQGAEAPGGGGPIYSAGFARFLMLLGP